MEVKQPNIFKKTTQRKHSPWTGKVPGEQASRRRSEGQDHQYESAVKENPSFQEKSQPREQANRNFPDSKSNQEQFIGMSSARGGTEAGSNSPKRPEKRGDSSNAVEASADGAGSARAAQRQDRQPANRDVPPSPHRLKTSRKQIQ